MGGMVEAAIPRPLAVRLAGRSPTSVPGDRQEVGPIGRFWCGGDSQFAFEAAGDDSKITRMAVDRYFRSKG